MMKKIFSVLFGILLISLASATVSLEKQPEQVYNIGDILEIPIKIIASQQINDVLSLKLTCGAIETELYKEYISLLEGEKSRDLAIPLIKSFIGESSGTCSVNYWLGLEQGNLSANFQLSNKVDLLIEDFETHFSPGETIILTGTAIKQNTKGIEGVIEANFSSTLSSNMIYSNIITDGDFSLEIILPQNTEAGEHQIDLYVYEKNSDGIIINNGSATTMVTVQQIPTNLEIILDKSKLNPGETLRGKVILHDQTGENMQEQTYIAIKNQKDEIIEKIERTTNEYFEYLINNTETPNNWKVSAYSNELTNVVAFTIKENKKIKTEILNSTIEVTNIGNVIYQDVLDIKIGETIKRIELNLEIGESQKYSLNAPNGKYVVEAGDESKTLSLTGKSIEVKKFAKNTISLKPSFWIFIILILGFITYLLFKKGYKKTFLGRHFKKSPKTQEHPIKKIIKKTSGFNSAHPAELSLSIKGTKQSSDLVGLNLKNFEEITTEQGNANETIQKIIDFAEEHKALTYITEENLFFILSPSKTKTFKNEVTALNIAREAEKILGHHNKLFKQKIDYGLAITSGDLVIHQATHGAKFMAMTNSITTLKKIASTSKKEILLSGKIRARLASLIKADKKEIGNIHVYKLKDVIAKIDNSKFITGFLERLQNDKEFQKKSKK